MENMDLIKNLKIALKNEEESANLYRKIADATHNHDIKNFFHALEKEETAHYDYLMQYYQRLKKVAHVKEFAIEVKYFEKPSKEIFDDVFLRDISSSKTIIQAMQTAARKEKNAAEFYDNCKKYTRDKELLTFFDRMVSWETNHLEVILYMFENMDEPEFAGEFY